MGSVPQRQLLFMELTVTGLEKAEDECKFILAISAFSCSVDNAITAGQPPGPGGKAGWVYH